MSERDIRGDNTSQGWSSGNGGSNRRDNDRDRDHGYSSRHASDRGQQHMSVNANYNRGNHYGSGSGRWQQDHDGHDDQRRDYLESTRRNDGNSHSNWNGGNSHHYGNDNSFGNNRRDNDRVRGNSAGNRDRGSDRRDWHQYRDSSSTQQHRGSTYDRDTPPPPNADADGRGGGEEGVLLPAVKRAKAEEGRDHDVHMDPGVKTEYIPTTSASQAAHHAGLTSAISNPSNSRVYNSQAHLVDGTAALVINDKNWDAHPLDEKLESQFPFDIGNLYIREQLNDDTDVWVKRKGDCAKWAFIEVSEEMKKDFPDDDPDSASDDSEDNNIEENMFAGQPGHRYPYTLKELEIFSNALPYNLFLDAGFRIINCNVNDDQYCYCPCSKRCMKWKKNFHLSGLAKGGDNCLKYKEGDPNALMDHLRKIGMEAGGILHKVVYHYLSKLYYNYWGFISPGVSHKSQYPKQTPKYNAAEAAGNKCLLEAVKFYKSKMDEQERLLAEGKQRAEDLAKLAVVNEKLSDDYKKMQADFELLKIKPSTHKQKDMAPEEFDRCRKLVSGSFDLATSTIIKMRDTAIDIKVGHNIDIQKLFDDLYKKGEKEVDYRLFRDLKPYNNDEMFHAWRIIQKWNIKYEALLNNTTTNKDLMAVDAGGPTRHFIEEFCSQMGGLVLHVPIKADRVENCLGVKVGCDVEVKDSGNYAKIQRKAGSGTKWWVKYYNDEREERLKRNKFTVKKYPIKLFDDAFRENSESSSYFPMRDDHFESQMAHLDPYDPGISLKELIKKAKVYYRAIGRVMLHVLVDSEYTLSSTIMPQLLRNVLLRGVQPQSPEYDQEDLVKHLAEIGERGVLDKATKGNLGSGCTFGDYEVEAEIIDKFNKGDKFLAVDAKEGEKVSEKTVQRHDLITADNFKSTFVYLHMLASRQISLENILDGLTFGGKFNIQRIFSAVPLQFVNKYAFEKPNYDVLEILKIIEPKYVNDDEQLDESMLEDRKTFIEEVFKPSMKKLAEKSSTFLQEFLFFVTGSSIMPFLETSPDYRISIVFADSLLDSDSLPVGRTCFKQLDIPLFHYGNDPDVLMEKLNISVVLGGSAGFGME